MCNVILLTLLFCQLNPNKESSPSIAQLAAGGGCAMTKSIGGAWSM